MTLHRAWLDGHLVADGGTTTDDVDRATSIQADRTTVHSVLASDSRAAVIEWLADRHEHAHIEALAGFVASRTRRSTRTAKISLRHRHLPELVEAGAVHWNERTGDVDATPQTDAFYEISQFAEMRMVDEDEKDLVTDGGTDLHEVTDPDTGVRLYHYEWNGWWWCDNEMAAFDWETGDVTCPHCGETFHVPEPRTDGGRPVAHTERGTPLPGQRRCPEGHLCSKRDNYCRCCGYEFVLGGDEDV